MTDLSAEFKALAEYRPTHKVAPDEISMCC